jgi:threonine dehydrogenase-like Zn-dependent dehydrogenase
VRAIVLDENGVRFDHDRPEPTLARGEVIVRVLRAGVCETDLQLLRGYKQFRGVLGHEFVGIALSGPFEGRRVVGEINCGCGHCDTCASGDRRHCPTRRVIGIAGHDGAFADRVAVPQSNLHLVPENVDTELAVFTEPIAAACRIGEQVVIRRDNRIVVLGDGRLGNLCAQVLAHASKHLLVIGKHAKKLAILESLGLATCLLANRPLERMADIVVDCTGSETGLATALELVRPRGTIVLKTTIAGSQSLACAPIVVDEVTVIGSRCGRFDTALDTLVSGMVDVRPLISARYDLSDGVAALSRAAEDDVVKVLLDCASFFDPARG